MPRHLRVPVAVAAALAVTGCATLGPDRGRIDTTAMVGARSSADLEWTASPDADAQADALRREPMTPVAAVQMALVRSPRLQQEYARLGLIRADVQEAVQISNPHLSIVRLFGEGDGLLTLGLAMPLIDLLTMPSRLRLARADYERGKSEIGAAILVVAAEVEAGWYGYVGAQQIAGMRATVARGMAASAELAQRFYDAGNITELQLKQEQAAATQARIEAARATAEASRTRLELNTLIGLSGPLAEWPVTALLPQPVTREDEAQELAALSGSNLRLLAARQEVVVMEGILNTTRRFRWLGGTRIGIEHEREPDGARLTGPTADIELPIFNRGQAKVTRAQARLAEARARLAQIEVASGNAVRLGVERIKVLRDIIDMHRTALIPERENIVARSQEQQNYMLIGVFELIQAKRQEYEAYQSYLESIRDYWLARIDLMRAVGARLPSEMRGVAPDATVKDPGKPSRNEGGQR
ncbi:MAG TPA: TolC family protein [Gemmatimonadaceae bacterium]|nr:TolC family protein [Gemmatimonadaceae bacterium]